MSSKIYRFQPRWKEELICTTTEGAFILVFAMGIPTVYLPSQNHWPSVAPPWAKSHWQILNAQLSQWCAQHQTEFIIDDNAYVSEEPNAYSQALMQLVDEAMHALPDTCQSAVLTIIRQSEGIQCDFNNETDTLPIFISDSLAQQCKQYALLFQHADDAWLEAVIRFYQTNGQWDFVADYEYPTKVADKVPKPFWKFW